MSSQQRFLTLTEAAQAQNVEAVTEMLHSGYGVNFQDDDGNTALHWVCWFRLENLLTKLMESNARPDIGNTAGETPVHWAAKSSNVTALDTMTKLDRGLLSQRDCGGFTPFLISAHNDNASIMEWMYLKGISVEEQDDFGRTALQWACYKGHRRTVQWLLSRSASVMHRDHEGMTAIHWAALKGHEQAAEMLLDVGAVQLLHVPDIGGDTPIDLAMRKKNRYLVMCFHKCQLFQFLFGRPHISHNHFANLFVGFVAFNVFVFAFILGPGIANHHPKSVLVWSFLICLSLILWVQNCFADPGWITPQTIFPQHHLIGDDPTTGFDADQPVESQMAHCDSISQELVGDEEAYSIKAGNLARLELEQNKFNYQRQLIAKAKHRLDENGLRARGSGNLVAAGTGGTELQPLMTPQETAAAGDAATAQQAQLERAAIALRERERATGESLGRARVEFLLEEGCGEYLTLVEKGDFKQVCVVCRARRKMRSHHCKECGRCVERLDHHCPWIDNCVGLGNQRSFYCFIVVLLMTVCFFYQIIFLYAIDTVFPEIARSSFSGFIRNLFSGSLGLLYPLLVLICGAFDLIWVAFVGALVARHTAYMIMNLTTYEVLVRPAHVQRRFPKNKGRFWFLQGCGFDSLQHCFDYWTLNTDNDAADFLGTTPQDSFMASAAQDTRPQGKRERHSSSVLGDFAGPAPAYQLLPSSSSSVPLPEQGTGFHRSAWGGGFQ